MARRFKLVVIAALAFTVIMLMYTSQLRDTSARDERTIQDFYHKTKGALREKGAAGGGGAAAGAASAPLTDMDNDGDIDDEDARLALKMQERLKAAEQKAKDDANAKAPNRPDPPKDVIGVGSSASGQKAGGAVAGAAGAAGAASKSNAVAGTNTAVEEELRSIFKKSPVVIFSKSYCPYSKRAKATLLEKYAIEPAPFVVELDQHPMGAAMQARLAEITGRRTVPNIMVQGESIGGSDEITAMDMNKKLIGTVTSLGGSSLTMKERM